MDAEHRLKETRLQNLAQKLNDYYIHKLSRTSKTCDVCSAKAEFYIEWLWPAYRDYFCLSCAMEANPQEMTRQLEECKVELSKLPLGVENV